MTRKEPLDALFEAQTLYEEYLELNSVPVLNLLNEPSPPPLISWEIPFNLTIVHQSNDARVE